MRRLLAAAAVLVLGPAGLPTESARAQEPVPADTAAARDTAAVDSPDTVAPGAGALPPSAEGHVFLGGYAILAHDPGTGQTGVAAATSGFSAGSGSAGLEPGGAVAVLGRSSPAARRAAMAALRSGASAGEAVSRATDAAGRAGGLHVSVLTPACAGRSFTAEDAYPWTGAVSGRAGRICYRAAGALLADSAVVRRLSSAFEAAEEGLLERFHAALSAAERASGEVARSRSGLIWISAPDAASGALGRADLRLQVEDVQRPAAALRYLVRAGRADHLARRASAAVDAGDHQGALELADRAVDLEPATALAWLARGRALLHRGEDREAETAFQRMLEVNPHLLHLLGDPAAAVADTAGGRGAGAPEVRTDLIPYRPRLILRLDEYRRAFFRDVEFPSREPEPSPAGAGGGSEGGTP